MEAIPKGLTPMEPSIIATGPLTSECLSADIAAFVGADHLYFYDAISPIVLAETIDWKRVFRASRWGRDSVETAPGTSSDQQPGDYVNCPLTTDEYDRFFEALTNAESATVRDFDHAKFLRRSCTTLPIHPQGAPHVLLRADTEKRQLD